MPYVFYTDINFVINHEIKANKEQIKKKVFGFSTLDKKMQD